MQGHIVGVNRYAWGVSGFFGGSLLLDVHVLEFAGIEDLTALFAFHEFAVFFAGNNLDTWVFALLHGLSLWLAYLFWLA